jgi:chemotaxis protein CheY-P-specific phosphatase CheC
VFAGDFATAVANIACLMEQITTPEFAKRKDAILSFPISHASKLKFQHALFQVRLI